MEELMLSPNKRKQIDERLDAVGGNFLRDWELYGETWVRNEYHLEDFNLWELEEWAQGKTDKTLLADRGILHDPHSGTDYMDDLLNIILKRFAAYEEKEREDAATIERLTQANKYFRSHPMESVNEKISKLVKEGTPDDNKRRH
jgi:polyhydroxyalkanoate synthesis regulator phasin